MTLQHRLHFIPHRDHEKDVQQQGDRQRQPQAAMVARCFAPAHLMQHGAGGSVERMQATVRARSRREPAMVFDLIGAFDKPSSVQ
jgi:uroporphyrinogen-III decarboxylase